MTNRRTILKFLGALFLYAAIVTAFWLSGFFAVVVCEDHGGPWAGGGDSSWDTLNYLIVTALVAPALLGGLYLAQLFLWVARGRVLLLRYRLGLDALFSLLFSLAICWEHHDFEWAALGVLFLFPVVVLCLGDLVMTGYVRLVDPEKAHRPKPEPPPPSGQFMILGGSIPSPIRPAPRTHQ